MTRITTIATTRVLACLAALAAVNLPVAAPAVAQGTQPTGPPQGPAAQRAAPQQAAQQESGIDWRTGWSYGARGVLSMLAESSLDTGLGFAGFAVLPLSTDFEIEGEIGFQTMNTVPDGLPAGRLSMFPLRATLRVQLWRFGSAKPYAGGGAGLYFSRFSIDQSVLDELAIVGFSASANVDPGLGFHAAGGVEWQRDRFHFGVDVKYVIGNADAISTVVDQVTEQVIRETSQISFDGIWIGAGARINF